MSLEVLNQILTDLNTRRYNNEISHQAWWITVQSIRETVTSAGYTWDELVAA